MREKEKEREMKGIDGVGNKKENLFLDPLPSHTHTHDRTHTHTKREEFPSLYHQFVDVWLASGVGSEGGRESAGERGGSAAHLIPVGE